METLMETLYVSDLDGTLLDKNAAVPHAAAEALRLLHEKGAAVTFATARTIQSVRHILSDVPTEYPVALMNGVLICDMADGEKYISAAYFDLFVFDRVRDILDGCGITPFMYFLDGGSLRTAYTDITNGYMESFMDERIRKYNKPFVRLADGEPYPGRPIYFAAMDTEDKIRKANSLCLEMEELRTACYRDSYDPDFWYLEVFDKAASKKNAVEIIRNITGARRIVSFGDNYNDIPMFESSDECYAVKSAPDEVIAASDGTVDGADELGVVRKIAELERVDIEI